MSGLRVMSNPSEGWLGKERKKKRRREVGNGGTVAVLRGEVRPTHSETNLRGPRPRTPTRS